MGEYNNEKDKHVYKKCSKAIYSDNLGAIHCEPCPENYTSLYGASKCDSYEDIISHCNFSDKNGICLEYNN